MKLSNASADIHVPDGLAPSEALARITHLGVGAHHDDLEFMAFHGIIACHESDREWFGGVTCTDGAGSARKGPFAHFTDAEMREIRRAEQNAAARIGRYGVMIQLGHSSETVKAPGATSLRDDLRQVLLATHPRVVYIHNLADKHPTHVAVGLAAIHALRALPPEARPESVYGCEVWRGLDWMLDEDKVAQDVGGHDELAAALNGVFASQIAGGKRYDLAVIGRRRANATFSEPHAVDRSEGIALAMDLTPLVRDEALDIAEYVNGFVERFQADVISKLRGQR